MSQNYTELQRQIEQILGRRITGETRVVHKFGRNPAVGATFVAVAIDALYPMVQPASATTLRVKAGNANNTAAGSGAREITLEGLDETGAEVEETVPTAGIAAGAASTATFLRLFRAWVSKSGTYATTTASSHTAGADITIENGAGGTDWMTIDGTAFAKSQSECAFYTVPLGWTGFIPSFKASVDGTKTPNVILFKRENILEAAAPYSAMRAQLVLDGLTSDVHLRPLTPIGPFPALTDIGWMANVAASTASVNIDFEVLLVK